MAATLPDSTLQGLESRTQDLRGLWARRAFLAALVVVLAAGLLGLLGVRTSTVSDSADGWTVTVERAAVARAGLDVPFNVTVRHDGGFDRASLLEAIRAEL